MRADIELRCWVVLAIAATGNREVARYRLRGDAESHSQSLNRLLPNGGFTVLFEEPQISLR